MDYSESLNFEFNRIVNNNPNLTPEEKQKVISEGIKTPIERKDDIIFPFDKVNKFEGIFLGEAPEYIEGNLKVQVYKFKDLKGKNWLIPQYNLLKEYFKNIPQAKSIFIIEFKGARTTETGDFYYQFKIEIKAI